MSDSQTPIQLLRELERRGREHARPLPQPREAESSWDGIAFTLDGRQWLAAMGEVKAIVRHPAISAVPGAKRWVRGVANVHGTLMPIIDLRDLLLRQPTPLTGRNRILVMHYKGGAAGLLVEEVIGVRHFAEEEFSADAAEARPPLAGLLRGRYRRDGESWGVLSIDALAELPEFMQLAAEEQSSVEEPRR